LLEASGAHTEAIEFANKARAAFERLAKAQPDETEDRYQLVLALNLLGRAHLALKKSGDAMSSYEAALRAGAEGFEDSEELEYRHVVAQTRSALGELYRQEEKAGCGELLFSAFAILGQLVGAHPDSNLFQYELASVSRSLAALGLPGPPQQDFGRTALAIAEKLARSHPDVPDYEFLQAKAIALFGLREAYSGRIPQSRILLTRALAVTDLLVKADPGCTDYSDLAALIRIWGASNLAREKKHKQAMAEVEAVQKAPRKDGLLLYNLAAVVAACAQLVSDDPSMPKAERDKLSEEYATRAIGLLRECYGSGFKRRIVLMYEPSFNSLRKREDFKKLLAEVSARQ
jgi:tetratricopeptide (TPR) repeat protein